jgi:hypothetical protein
MMIGIVHFVRVWSSLGISISGRSLRARAVDGQLPNIMVDSKELVLTSVSVEVTTLMSLGGI